MGADGSGTPWAHYQICGENICLAILPVVEFQDGFANAKQWLHFNVEVIGAIDLLALPAMDPTKYPTVFQVWSISEAPDPGRRSRS
jgi:hypothetical protein